jgi:hypothetical protein
MANPFAISSPNAVLQVIKDRKMKLGVSCTPAVPVSKRIKQEDHKF